MKRNAFTLIELLVVIAIIAILAAILFPVFAQAKEQAKNTAMLTHIKQMGTASHIYSSDYDDLMPAAGDATKTSWWLGGWQYTTQPYMKNLELIINPKRSKPTSPVPEYYDFQRMQHFAMPVRAEVAGQTAGYYTGTHNGQATRYNGVAGYAANPAAGATNYYVTNSVASLSNTQVEDVSNTALIVEGSNWEAWWGVLGYANPMSYCIRWIPDTANANGTSYSYPITTTTRPMDGRSGLTHGGGTCALPLGQTTFVATDSSAKRLDFRQNFYNPTPSKNNSTIYVVKNLNPLGI